MFNLACKLVALHLHDNDGDQHHIPYEGSIDWKAYLAYFLSSFSYTYKSIIYRFQPDLTILTMHYADLLWEFTF